MKTKTLILIALSALPIHAFACDLPHLQNQAFESIKARNPKAQNVKLSSPTKASQGMLATYSVPVNGNATYQAAQFAIDVQNCRAVPVAAAEVEYYNHVSTTVIPGAEVYDNIPSDEPVSDQVGGRNNPPPGL